MTYADDYGDDDLYSDIALAAPTALIEPGAASPPTAWPVWGPGSPEAGQRVTEQQARYYSSARPAPDGNPGPTGSSPYNPSYDTPSLTGGPDTYHVTLDGRLVSPVSAAASDPLSTSPSSTSDDGVGDVGGLLPLPDDLSTSDGLLPVPSDLRTSGGAQDGGLLSAAPPAQSTLGSPDLRAVGLLDRLAWIHSRTPPTTPPPPRPWFGGAPAGWHGDPNSRQNMSVAEDAGRSLVTGGERGVTDLVGLPGSLADWAGKRLDDGLVATGDALGLVKDRDDLRRRLYAASEAARKQSPLTRYTTGDLDQLVQSVAGPYHVPQTFAGRLANAVGENAPTALLPGGLAVRAARVVLPALGTTVAGDLTNQNPLAKTAGGLLGGLAANGEGLLARAPRSFPEPAGGAPHPLPDAEPDPTPSLDAPSKQVSGADGDGDEEATQGADLQPYRKGQGHHGPAKRAFEGADGYSAWSAPAIPKGELQRLGIDHDAITSAQRVLYGEFAKSGHPLTWEAAQDIETKALVRAGMESNVAETTVRNAIAALRANGVREPVRIPWRPKNAVP